MNGSEESPLRFFLSFHNSIHHNSYISPACHYLVKSPFPEKSFLKYSINHRWMPCSIELLFSYVARVKEPASWFVIRNFFYIIVLKKNYPRLEIRRSFLTFCVCMEEIIRRVRQHSVSFGIAWNSQKNVSFFIIISPDKSFWNRCSSLWERREVGWKGGWMSSKSLALSYLNIVFENSKNSAFRLWIWSVFSSYEKIKFMIT